MSQKRSNAKIAKPRSLPEQTRRLLANFCNEDHVLVLIDADPDSLASSLALKRLLWRRVASVSIASINQMRRPDNLAMVRLLQIPVKFVDEVDPAKHNKHVMVDGQPKHNVAFAGFEPQVIIDHHPVSEEHAGASFVDIRPRYGATSSIMTEYLRGAKISPSARLATALVYGIKTDTASFGRPTVEADVHAFRFLFPRANQSVLRKIEFSEMRLQDLSLLKLALDRMVVRGHRMFAHLGDVESADNLVQIADFFQRVDTVDTCAVSGVCGQKLVVVFRNVAPRHNAGKVAQEAFGDLGQAGGHKSMARAEVPLDNIRSLVDPTDHDSLALFIRLLIQFPAKNPPAAGKKPKRQQ